ncbi:hypothetical protein ACFQJD_08580 [Haloplanus sp. GCM10025708]|uniref:hypothetical protein n=1 Tax=Haloferacaceae TaxID=1644056 RepID=UPI00361EA5B7
MFDFLQRAGTFVLYQTALLLGIVMMPLALAMRRVGLRLPFHEVVEATERAYENTK